MARVKQGVRIRETLGSRFFNAVNYLLMTLMMVLVLYPIYYMLIVSVSDGAAVMTGKVTLFPVGFHWDVYKQFLTDSYFLGTYKSTLIITVLGTTINLIMTTLCAYPLSRRDFYGGSVISGLIAFTMFFSGGMIPLYLLVNQLRMLNTYWAVTVPGAINVFNMIIMRTSMQGLPVELHESATIDGANDLQILSKIVLPLSKPILATMVLFYSVAHWNGYVHAMLYFTDKNMYPIQLYVRSLVMDGLTEMTSLSLDLSSGAGSQRIAQRSIQYGVIISAMLPILFVYPFISKYFEKGVMVGSLKG